MLYNCGHCKRPGIKTPLGAPDTGYFYKSSINMDSAGE
jgi:hypothetical protein